MAREVIYARSSNPPNYTHPTAKTSPTLSELQTKIQHPYIALIGKIDSDEPGSVASPTNRANAEISPNRHESFIPGETE
jgi:hypothetical protein